MEQIQDGRRNVLIHANKEPADLPLEDVPELPAVRNTEPFVPVNMDEPKLYPGDVIVGVRDGVIEYAELIQKKVDGAVLVVELDTGEHAVHADQQFSSRFYRNDEVHVYDDVAEEAEDLENSFDGSKLERPETGRQR